MTGHGKVPRAPLLLVPGTLCDEELWKPQSRSLADCTVPQVVDLSRDETIASMAAAALEAAPPRFLLAGLSMGAIVAFEIMRRSPARVLGLALLNTSPSVPDAGQIQAWREEIELTERGFFTALIEERWIPMLLAASGSRARSVQDTVRRMALRVGPAGYVRQLRAQIGRRESWSSLVHIACPTIVLGGDQDTICPPSLQAAMAAAVPNARLVLVEDCGHLSTLEQPEHVTVLLRTWVAETLESLHSTPLRGHSA